MKTIIAFALRKIYGVRGALKPPIGGPYAKAFYRLRYSWWRIISRIYNWSGLPEKWDKQFFRY